LIVVKSFANRERNMQIVNKECFIKKKNDIESILFENIEKYFASVIELEN